MKPSFRLCFGGVVPLLSALGILSSTTFLAGQVKVWEDELLLLTYEEGLPDINPPFDLFQQRSFSTYPYTTRENLTHRRSMRAWRTLNLENEYLKVTVLPDLGGRLYSCVDKSNGAEMFYANSSIKFAQVAYRGAWVALGIEFNFPVSHNWVTVSPVDFAIVKHEDGSGSIWVGNIDRPYGMLWRVVLTLRPGRSLLEQTVTLYNHDFERHRYYWWNTCSVESWDDSRIIYPMRYTASHGFTNIDTWPVDSSGLDLSLPKNHIRGFVSRFSYGSREPFMGVYHPHSEAGMVHFAFADEVPGKKIWSWGWDARGHTWREALSDDHSGYLEIQAGLFRNQETYSFLEPQELLQFKEYYMPVRKIGGFSRANPVGVIYLDRDPADAALRVGLNVNEELSEERLLILQQDQKIAEVELTLKPSGYFDRLFPGLNAQSPYTVILREKSGRTLLTHTEGEYDLLPDSEIRLGQQERYRFPPQPLRREADFVEMGRLEELNGRLLAACELYQEGIGLFPQSFLIAKAAGRLAVQLKRYQEAVDLLSLARRQVDNDQELLYYLGAAYWRLGDLDRARQAWEDATVMPGFRVPGQLQLARISTRQKNWERAQQLLRRVLAEAPRTLRAGYLEIALYRKIGKVQNATRRLEHWREIDPANSFLRHESILLGKQDEQLWHHLAGDPERVLQLATEYMAMGFYDDALGLLTRTYPASAVHQEPGTALPQDYPLITYYRGYCREELGQFGGDDFETASRQSTLFVFPNRPESIDVLKAAVKYNPTDATAHLLLGALYLSGGRSEMALEEWEKARRLDPYLPTLHRNLGFTQLLAMSNPQSALQTFSEGIALDPKNSGLYLGSDQCMSLLDFAPQERVQILSDYPEPNSMPSVLLLSLALALTEAGQFAEAETLFLNREFIREEFGTNVHEVYMENQLQKALTETKTSECGTAPITVENLGKPVPGLSFTTEGGERFINSARVQYYLGEIQEKCGSSEAATVHWHHAAATDRWDDLYYGYLAARKLGREGSQAAWMVKLEEGLEKAKSYSGSNRGMNAYTRGSLLLALGRRQEAVKSLRQVFLFPDKGMSHYLSRELLRESR